MSIGNCFSYVLLADYCFEIWVSSKFKIHSYAQMMGNHTESKREDKSSNPLWRVTANLSENGSCLREAEFFYGTICELFRSMWKHSYIVKPQQTDTWSAEKCKRGSSIFNSIFNYLGNVEFYVLQLYRWWDGHLESHTNSSLCNCGTVPIGKEEQIWKTENAYINILNFLVNSTTIWIVKYVAVDISFILSMDLNLPPT